MTKNNWWKYLCLCVVSLMLSGCSMLENLFFAKTEVPEFSFSGYVMADGKALEGAIVDCGMLSTETNESGYYKFSGVNKVVQVSVKKDGYLFADDLVFVNSLSSDVNFRGYQLFDKSGVVKNNDIVISDVDIVAVSENGLFTTKSNEYGEFYLTGLAGQVKVSATKDGFSFFKSSFTIDKEDDVIISGLTNISGTINVDIDNASAQDFTLKVDDREIDIADDFTFVATNVEPGAVVSLASNEYYIANNTQIVLSDLETIQFDCKKYYDVSGNVVCGNKTITNATVKCGNKEISTVDGTFKFERLYGENIITAVASGFEFVGHNVDAIKTNISIDSKTSVKGKITLDIGQSFEEIILAFNNKNIAVDTFGNFTLTDVKFGDKLSISSDTYFVTNELTIDDSYLLDICAYKLYSLNLSVLAEDESVSGVNVLINGNSYVTNEQGVLSVNGLYGDTQVSLNKDGYKFDDNYSYNYFSKDASIIGYQLYNVSGIIKSGDITITSGQVRLGDTSLDINNDGTFALNNLYGEQHLLITADGYNGQELVVSKDNANINVDLTYDISGTITCGGKVIEGVQVSAGDKIDITSTSGAFTLSGLIGTTSLSYSKTWYTFPLGNVTHAENINVYGKYSLSGRVSKKKDNEEGLDYLNNFKILLINKQTNDIITTYTNSDGYYTFDELDGEYALIYDMDSVLALKPAMYDISTGGHFDFSNNGYSFGGTIMCGDLPLANATLSIGNAVVYTDSDGKYTFPLVTGTGVISVEKTGYSFSPINHNGSANDNFDGKTNIDYNATYMVSGVVKSGNIPVGGVNVQIGSKNTRTDNNGVFEISGLSGSNNITLALNNYKFAGASQINGYANLNYSATFDCLVKVISQDILVAGANLTLNNINTNLSTSNNGEIIITDIKLGDKIAFALPGYTIESREFTEYTEECVVNALYSVSGVVSNCGMPLNHVKVSIEDTEIFVTTNELGEFTIRDISGSITLAFEKDDFDFDTVEIHGAQNINVMTKFDVEGIIKVGDTPISGVVITAGDITATSDKLGKFKITSLQAVTQFTFAKTGYDFPSTTVSTPDYLNIYGTYKVTIKVKSGDLSLSDAIIYINGSVSGVNEENGQYEITGLAGSTSIRVELSGYNAKEFVVSEYTPNLIANLDYDLVINFSGIDNYSGITITANSKSYSCDSNTYTITGLKGETTVVLAKDNCYFTPTENNSFKVDKNTIKNITITKLFSISGTVKTTSGIPVAQAYVYAGKKYTTTDNNGKYMLTGLSGEPSLQVVLPYNSNGTYSKELEIMGTSAKADSINNITVPDKTFAINFLNYAYDNLRYAMSYQIFGSGKVTASPDVAGVSDQIQSVSVVYKQDALGNKIFQNMNVGSRIKILSLVDVDPNVSLLSVFYTDTDGVRKVKYNQIKGEDNIAQNNGNPAYTDTWTYTDVASYKNNFGVDYNGFSPYVITSKTVQSVSNLKYTDDKYTFTLNLDCTPEAGAYTYYEKLMTVMCNQQELNSFSKIALTFTITNSGLMRQMIIDENYEVNSNGTDAATKANITYNFFIGSLTEKIQDIDISTPQTVQTSILLGQETPVEMGGAQAVNYKPENKNTHCDIITYRKEELL